MIIDFNRYNGGGGSGSGVTPQQVQAQIDSALTPYWESGETKDYVDEALSGFTPGGNSNILAAISSQTEYEAISGNVKTGDLIQVFGVDINGDDEAVDGLFEADVRETEDQGVITKEIIWQRRDNADSVLWGDRDYPWMVDNDVYPIDLGRDCFIISDTEPEGFNGIGFDGDGKPVITHIVPQYEEGEVTGMTRQDTPIGSLPVGYDVVDQYAIAENYQIVTVDGKVFGEDLDEVPAFHTFEDGYSDEERGYVIGSYAQVFGYYDGDDNFVPVFLPAGTYAILNNDEGSDNYGKVMNLFYGKVGDEDVIYCGDNWAQQLDSISLVSPLFTITEPTCPTTEENYYQLYLDYTDKPSGTDTGDIELPIAAAVNELKSNIEAKLDQQYYKKAEVNDIAARKLEAGQVDAKIHNYVDPAIAEINASIEDKELATSAALNELNSTTVKSTTVKNIWTGSQSDYDDIVVKDPETLYIINN
jgi:hypothetical protein